MAVGAQRADVVGMILRQGLTLAATGIAIGLLLSFALMGFLKSLLFGVRDRL
jgi:ABC-type antimicrobial peptide transport system permease subunit